MLYKGDFVKLAEAFRQARKQLKAERVENTYPVKVVLKYLMEMLQRENPRFSREKFISYIQAEEGGK